jgi:hypothetical protein
MADDEGEPRADETLGIDRSEQAGLGGEASVLEEYGEDTHPDDLPEKPSMPLEAPLPGTDPDLPADLAVADGGPDPNLPLPGHELKPGISKAGDAPLKRPGDLREAIEASDVGEQARTGASGNVE